MGSGTIVSEGNLIRSALKHPNRPDMYIPVAVGTVLSGSRDASKRMDTSMGAAHKSKERIP
jgi:hypothetical protein